MKKLLFLLPIVASMLFSCGDKPDFIDVTTKVISPVLSPEDESTKPESPEGFMPFGDHYYIKDHQIYNKKLEFVCTDSKDYNAPWGSNADYEVLYDGDMLYYEYGKDTHYIIPQKGYEKLPSDTVELAKHDYYGTAYLSDGKLYLDFSNAQAIIDKGEDFAVIDLSYLVGGDFKCTSAAFSYPYAINILLETDEGLKHFSVSGTIVTQSGERYFESRLMGVEPKDNFFGNYLYNIVPNITWVLDLDGNELAFFPGYNSDIAGEVLTLFTGEIEYKWMAYTKELKPIIIPGDAPEYATVFDELTMCPDESFIAKTENGNTLYHYSPDGELLSAAEFDRLFTAGMQLAGIPPYAAAVHSGRFVFVNANGDVVAELSYDDSLEFFSAHHTREQGTDEWYYQVSFTESGERFNNSVRYYISEDGTDFGVEGLEDEEKTIIYSDGALRVYFEKGKYAASLTYTTEETVYFDDMMLGTYYDPLFGKTKSQPIFVKEEDGQYVLYTYKYGSLNKGPKGKEFITVGDYIFINNGLYDYYLNGLYNFYDQYSGGIDVTEFYESDDKNSIIIKGISNFDEAVTYTFYKTLPSEELGENAELVCEYDRTNAAAELYMKDGEYYHHDTESSLTLKLPIGKGAVSAKMYYDNTVFLTETKDGLAGEAFEYCYISGYGIGRAPALFMTVNYPPDPGTTVTFGDNTLVSLAGETHLLNNGKYISTFESEFGFKIIGDFLLMYEGPISNGGTVYDTDLREIFFGYDFTKLTDGRYIGWNDGRAYVISKDGETVFESDNGCLKVGDDFILMRDKDGVVRLYSPDMELMCEFPEWGEDYHFHTLLSGKKTASNVVGYYFVTEDPDDTKAYYEGAQHGEYGTHNYEFYYITETGESGIIDNGYGEFAYAKPVLYLYPEKETDVNITFAHPERLTTVYPSYNDGWTVTATPDGTLTDENGREYYCLYWEEDSETALYEFVNGFCVRGEDSADFLEEKLDILGFTHKEANEFIIYWLPILERSEYNLIRFELTEEREASNELNITPKPDSLLRMAMHIKPLDDKISIRKQALPTFNRSGFTAVEWGGCVH